MRPLIKISSCLVLILGLYYSGKAQICSIRGSQTGNFGGGGLGYSKTFRENINDNKAYAIINNKIIKVAGVTLADQKLEYFQINSTSSPVQLITVSRPDSTSLNWKIPSSPVRKNN